MLIALRVVEASLLVDLTFFWRSTVALHDIHPEEQREGLSPMGSPFEPEHSFLNESE